LLIGFGLISILAQFGVEVIPLLTTLGLAGIAVGLAAQPTLANFIAGVILLVERPFRTGDWVEIGGQTGKVVEITLRTTHLVTRDNVHTVIPNDAVASAEIVNFSTGGPLRIRVNLGIAYKESAQAARDVLMPVVENHPAVLKDRPPHLIVTELGDSSIDLEIRCWIDVADIDVRTRIRAAILESCKEALDEAGIQIPFPHASSSSTRLVDSSPIWRALKRGATRRESSTS
jgi:small conductance mechanosensitive channel